MIEDWFYKKDEKEYLVIIEHTKFSSINNKYIQHLVCSLLETDTSELLEK